MPSISVYLGFTGYNLPAYPSRLKKWKGRPFSLFASGDAPIIAMDFGLSILAKTFDNYKSPREIFVAKY